MSSASNLLYPAQMLGKISLKRTISDKAQLPLLPALLGNDADDDDGHQHERASGLVIPLLDDNAGITSRRNPKRARAEHEAFVQPTQEDVDNNVRRAPAASESEQSRYPTFSTDRPAAEDVSPDSSVYDAVPVSAFGAALLRGMGVSVDADGRVQGQDTTSTATGKPVQPRHRAFGTARLGLGADPSPLSSIGRPVATARVDVQPTGQGTVASTTREVAQLGTLPAQRAEERFPWLFTGRIVWLQPRQGPSRPPGSTFTVPSTGCPGIVLQLEGVPGMDAMKVRVQAEGDGTVSIIHPKASSRAIATFDPSAAITTLEKAHARAIAVEEEHAAVARKEAQEKAEADARVFHKTDAAALSGSSAVTSNRDVQGQAHGGGNASQLHVARVQIASPGWLWPGIRVRVVDEHWERGAWFRAKGIVVDVPGGSGTECDLIFDGPQGRVMKSRVPAAVLATALPKPGGHVFFLVGARRGSQGILISRDAASGTGRVQSMADDKVVAVSLDDIAEAVDA